MRSDMNDYYKQLEGYKISKFLGVTTEEDIDGFPQFLLTKKGYEDIMIEISRDEEGNGGGFMFIGEPK